MTRREGIKSFDLISIASLLPKGASAQLILAEAAPGPAAPVACVRTSGFYQRMLSDLQDWEADSLPGKPMLVVVSAGAAEDGRVMGLRSPVLLDPTGYAGSTFGANGTPMGILIDAKGRIASEVATGAQAVLELAGKQQDHPITIVEN